MPSGTVPGSGSHRPGPAGSRAGSASAQRATWASRRRPASLPHAAREVSRVAANSAASRAPTPSARSGNSPASTVADADATAERSGAASFWASASAVVSARGGREVGRAASALIVAGSVPQVQGGVRPADRDGGVRRRSEHDRGEENGIQHRRRGRGGLLALLETSAQTVTTGAAAGRRPRRRDGVRLDFWWRGVYLSLLP